MLFCVGFHVPPRGQFALKAPGGWQEGRNIGPVLYNSDTQKYTSSCEQLQPNSFFLYIFFKWFFFFFISLSKLSCKLRILSIAKNMQIYQKFKFQEGTSV